MTIGREGSSLVVCADMIYCIGGYDGMTILRSVSLLIVPTASLIVTGRRISLFVFRPVLNTAKELISKQLWYCIKTLSAVIGITKKINNFFPVKRSEFFRFSFRLTNEIL